jgi:sporulation protein YlmC with PRC-barrel domain
MSTKTTIRYLFTSTSLCLVLTAAQDPAPGSKPPGTTQTPATQTPTSPSSITPRSTNPQDARRLQLQRGDRLMGMDISDRSGGRLGKVEDIVMRPDGTVGYVVVQATVDGQSRLVPLPWSSLQFQGGPPESGQTPGAGASTTRADGTLKTIFEVDRLKTAPNFTADQWPMEGKDTVFSEADSFFGRSTVPGSTLRVSKLRNLGVVDAAGKTVGTFGHTIVDPVSGRINYATLSLADGRVIAVPWQTFQATRQDGKDKLQINFPADRLQDAPQFQPGEDSWKQMSDPAWVSELYS